MNIFSRIFAKQKVNDSSGLNELPAASSSPSLIKDDLFEQNAKIDNAPSILIKEMASLEANDKRPNFKKLEQFKDDFAQMQAKYDLICKIRNLKPDFDLVSDFEQLYRSLFNVCNGYVQFDEQISQLLAAEDNLSAEIVKYTNIVNEMAAKYKLSPDWGGKKPQMINLGQQLNQKRNALLEQEATLEQKARSIYEEFAISYDLFYQNVPTLKEFIRA